MKQVSRDTKEEGFRLWLEGRTYREIEELFPGLRRSTLADYIGKKAKGVPDLEVLQQVNVALKKEGASAIFVLRAAKLLEKLDENDFDIDEIGFKALLGLISQYGQGIEGAIYAGLRLQQLQAMTGKDHETLVAETEAKSAAIAKQERRVDELRREEEQRKANLGNLRELSALKDKLERHGVTPQRVDSFIDFNAELSDNGFTVEASNVLARELRRIGSTPVHAASALVHLLKEHGDLEAAIREASELCGFAKVEIARMNRELQAKRTELDDRSVELDAKAREVQEIDSSIKRRHNTYDEIEKEHNATVTELQRRAAEAQEELLNLEKMKTMAIDRANGVITEFKESLGRMDATIREKRQLRVLTILLQEPRNSMSPGVVVPVGLLVVDALEQYVASHQDDVPGSNGILGCTRNLRLALTGYVRYSAR